MAQRLNHTREGKMLAFTDHIAYEIRMLHFTYQFLRLDALAFFNPIMANALIESFCIHARNLLEFFEETTSESDEQICSCHFTEGDYKAFVDGELDGTLRGKLHAQVAHLSYNRTKDDKDKIQPADRDVLVQFLSKEVGHFFRHLKSPYKESVPADLRPLCGQQ
jgi:hypothetical protein